MGDDDVYVSPKKCLPTSVLGFLRGREGEAGRVRQREINRNKRNAALSPRGFVLASFLAGS